MVTISSIPNALEFRRKSGNILITHKIWNTYSSSTKIISYKFRTHSHTSFNVGKYNGCVYVPQ